jgi:hypothetical protein
MLPKTWLVSFPELEEWFDFYEFDNIFEKLNNKNLDFFEVSKID